MNKTVEKKIKCYFLLIDGENPTQITKKIGCGNSSPKNWFPRLCKANSKKKELSKQQKNKIIELKKLFLTHKEIALIISATENQVKHYCQRNGIEYSQEELKEFKRKQNAIPELEVKCRISNRAKGKFKYYGNYERSGEGYRCDIQCTKCNAIKNISSSAIKGWKMGNIPRCDNCIELKKQEEEKRNLIKKLCKDLKFALKKKRNEQIFTKTCECCGNVFETPYETQLVCGNICRGKKKRLKQKKYHKDDRYKRFGIKENPNINAKSVYKRDDGICWICNISCDLNDYIETETGTIICGNNYPSVDHIVPISKGGTDTWDNVKCAHRICNSLRADNE